MAELVTIPNVPLLEVGEDWETSTGTFTFDHEDLLAAIDALSDPAIRTPVVKLGHTDPRFDGQPAVGRLKNLHLSENGMTLLGDYVGLPKWLADAMPSAYPRRSIEGAFGYASKTGRNHKFMLSGVALLGEAYPAITTLADIEAIWGAEAIEDIELVAASRGDGEFIFAEKVGTKVPKTKLVSAKATIDQVRQAWYDQLSGNDRYWMWIHQMELEPNQLIVEDEDERKLYRVPFSVNGDEVTFEDEVEVRIIYQDVSEVAASSNRAKKIVTYASKDDSTVDIVQTNAEEDAMTPDQLKAIGLADDATDEQINERLAALTAAEQAGQAGGGDATGTGEQTTATGDGSGGDQAGGQAPGEANPTDSDGNPTPSSNQGGTASSTGDGGTGDGGNVSASATPRVPAGTVLVDASELEQLRQNSQRGAEVWERQRLADRDAHIAAAVKDGKFAPARREHWEKAWEADPEGTKEAIDALASGLIPVTEKGTGKNEDVSASAENQYPDNWGKSLVARKEGAL